MKRKSIYAEGFSHKNPIPAACQVGNMLYSGSIQGTDAVTGAYGKNIDDQYEYNLGKDLVLEGTSNLLICDKKIKEFTTLTINKNNKKLLNNKHDKLYHLLTSKDSFYIGNIRFYDYNAAIDILLEKNKGKILSMKYV